MVHFHTHIYMAIKEVNKEESASDLFSVGIFMGLWIFQINLRSAYGLHVPRYIGKHVIQCRTRTGLVLVLTRSHPALDLVLI